MSGLLDAIGKIAGNTPAGVIAQGVGEVLDRVLPDPELKRQAQQQAFDLIANGTFAEKAGQAVQLAQIDVNRAAASDGKTHFRDGAGWVCTAGLALNLVKPLIEWGCVVAGHPIQLPPIDMTVNGPMLFGLLGLGAYHMNERVNGGKP